MFFFSFAADIPFRQAQLSKIPLPKMTETSGIDDSLYYPSSSIPTMIKDEPMKNFCAPYSGKICEKYLKGRFVYYNYTTDETGSLIYLNEQITASLWSEMVSPLMEPCRGPAEVLLCNYAFPSCDYGKLPVIPKPICREDCIAVKESFCYNQWALIEDNKQRGVYFKARGHFRLPECDSLPSHENKTKPDCSSAHLTEIKQEEVTYNCIKGRGRFYQGTVDRTKSGILCQRWDQQEPHNHNRPPTIFAEIQNAENHCRNAGGEEPQPWCYTIDPRVRWEHCDIPVCSKLFSQHLRFLSEILIKACFISYKIHTLIKLIS